MIFYGDTYLKMGLHNIHLHASRGSHNKEGGVPYVFSQLRGKNKRTREGSWVCCFTSVFTPFRRRKVKTASKFKVPFKD